MLQYLLHRSTAAHSPQSAGRRSLFKRLIPLAMLVALHGGLPQSKGADEAGNRDGRPNIVFLLTDDQRFDALGAMGNDIIQTPHLDRLASEGTVFTNAFVTTSICAISRASIVTGQFARRHGIVDFSTALTPEQFADTFPARLRAAGYRTAFVGKWGLGNPLPVDQYDAWYGFAGQGRYFEEEGGVHLTDKQGSDALEFLDTCSPEGAPFCLQVSFKAAHCDHGNTPDFTPAERFRPLYANVTIPLPELANEESFKSLPPFLRESEARLRWHDRFGTSDRYQRTVKDYYRLLTGVDDVVGRIVERLHERGLADNTIILFTSDNGFYLGDRGLAGKWFMHEESIRVPLVVYDPGAAAEARGQRREEMVLNIDVAPTILDWAGVAIPEAVQGRSLAPLLQADDGRVAWRGEWFYEHPFAHRTIPMSEGVRGERWKYVRYTSIDPPYEELYDLQHDPLEERNLAGDPDAADRLEAMRHQWQRLRDAAL